MLHQSLVFYPLQEIMLEVRLSHYWYDLRLRTEDFRQPVELVPEAIKEFWTPDSYFHHAKDAKQVKVSEGNSLVIVLHSFTSVPFRVRFS